MKYRPEVDGLRAFAVIPIVLFHAGVPGINGGFVGVDVFFVISGYLITSLIAQQLARGEFTLLQFYERRVRRILPALLGVVAFVLVGSMTFGLPEQAAETSRSAGAALLSASNFYFWNTTGYFASAGELKPLLHTWSLGVEEQFYFLFPLLLMAAARWRFRVASLVAIALPILFVFSLWLSYRSPSAAFYLLPARAWELGVGAVLAISPLPTVGSKAAREALGMLGAVLLCAAYVYIDSGDAFPGWVALLPCAGAFLVIYAATAGTMVGRFLAFPLFVWIGLISYSLYLWHWPIMVFARMYSGSVALSPGWAIGTVGASFAAAWFSWRFIEQPFRSSTSMPMRRVAIQLGAAASVLLIASLAIIASKGFPARVEPGVGLALSARTDIDPLRGQCAGVRPPALGRGCRFGEGDHLGYVLIGDSHAAALRPAVEASVPVSNAYGTLFWLASCPLLEGASGVHPGRHECKEFKKAAFEFVEGPEADSVKVVILAGRWPSIFLGTKPEAGGSYRTYLVDRDTSVKSPEATREVFERSLRRTVARIRRAGKQVVLVGAVPEPGFDVPITMALQRMHGHSSADVMGRAEVAARNHEVDEVLAKVATDHPGTVFIPVWPQLCGEEECRLSTGGVPYFYDDDHMTKTASAQKVGPILREAFVGLMRGDP